MEPPGQQGFEGFKESPDAPFYRSGAMSPQETWAEATRRLTRVLEAATIDAERRATPITVERVCGWHRAIFLTTFESHAGRMREDHESVLDRHDECLGWAIREDAQRTIDPLARLIVELAA